jgi:hypothetical protein
MSEGDRPPRGSWVAKFRALPPVIQAITGVLTLVSTALALLFALVPSLQPGGGGPRTPAKISGDMRYLSLERDVKYGLHLTAARLDASGYDEQQLGRVGNVVEVSASLGGLQGRAVPLVWSIYGVAGTNKQPVSDPRYLNQPAQPIQLAAGQFVGVLDVWVPIPPFNGDFVARVLILYKNAALKFVDSDTFAGKPRKPSALPLPTVSAPLVGTRCGIERWSVKTLTDPDAVNVDPQPRATSVLHLAGLQAPRALGRERIAPVELSTYRLDARLVEYKLEPDSDIHLVVAEPTTGETMIVEFPADGCTQGAAPSQRTNMSRARAELLRACGLPTPDPRPTQPFVRLRGTATITGVGFFDSVHGQTGVAQNGIELHPATHFTSTNCHQG